MRGNGAGLEQTFERRCNFVPPPLIVLTECFMECVKDPKYRQNNDIEKHKVQAFNLKRPAHRCRPKGDRPGFGGGRELVVLIHLLLGKPEFGFQEIKL